MNKYKIIIADDEEGIRYLAGLIIKEKFPDSVSTFCEDGQELLDKLTENKYDLAISDFNMPYFKGTEVIEKIRADSNCKNQNIPVIFMSGIDYQTAKTFADKIDNSEIIEKPFELDEFIKRIYNRLENGN